MEIKVGEYVRTEDGSITKIKEFYKSGIFYSIVGEDGTLYGNPEKVVKYHSPNIIDLIEVGDIIRVKGLEHVKEVIEDKFFNEDIFGNDVRAIIDDSHHENYSKQIKDYKILSVVTHEQFEEMEYKV